MSHDLSDRAGELSEEGKGFRYSHIYWERKKTLFVFGTDLYLRVLPICTFTNISSMLKKPCKNFGQIDLAKYLNHPWSTPHISCWNLSVSGKRSLLKMTFVCDKVSKFFHHYAVHFVEIQQYLGRGLVWVRDPLGPLTLTNLPKCAISGPWRD